MVGRNAGLDGVRKKSRQTELPPEETISDVDDVESPMAERLDGSHYRDDILRLMFICCHPELPPSQQIALALRIVSGAFRPADRQGLPGRRGGDGAADHPGQGADRQGRRPV